GQIATIAGPVVIVVTAAVEGRAFWLGVAPADEILGGRQSVPRHRPIEHADVHKLALACLLAMNYGGQNANQRIVRPAAHVGHLHAQWQRPVLSPPRVAGDPRQRQIVKVMSGPITVRSGLPVAGAGTINQAPADRPPSL